MSAKLTIAAAAATGPFDLTAFGAADWIVATSASGRARKNITTPLLTWAQTGGATETYFTGLISKNWSDGTPIASGSSTGGVYPAVTNGTGYTLTAPAGVDPRTLKIICGAYRCIVRVTATLSDGSAPVVNVAAATNASTATIADQSIVTIEYAAASEGQTLTVTVLTEANSTGGGAHTQGVALSLPASGGGGTQAPVLALAVSTSTVARDLSALGTQDWFVYPNSLSIVRKAAANVLAVGKVGDVIDGVWSTGAPLLSWSDGTPTASGSAAGGIYGWNGTTLPAGWGYTVTAPADKTLRTLTVFAGSYNCTMLVDVTISDGSSSAKTDSSAVNSNGEIKVDYVAASAGQTITVTITPISPTGNCNIGLRGAALTGQASGGTTKPSAPGKPTVTVGVASVSVTATPGSSGDAAASRYDAMVYAVDDSALLGTSYGAGFPIIVSGLPSEAVYVKVTASNGGGTSDPSVASDPVTPSAPQADVALGLNNAALCWSPGNWDDYGTHKQSITAGAYLKTSFTGVTSISVNLDMSAIVASGIAANLYPVIRTVIDGYIYSDAQLTSATTSVTRTGLSTGAHTLEFFIRAIDTGMARWTGANGIRVKSLTIPAGGTFFAPTVRGKRMEYHGDSITEGWLAPGPLNNNALHTAVPMIAQALNAEYGQIGFSGQGYDLSGGSRPAFRTSALYYSDTRSRLVGGLLSPMPDYICVEHGTNGTTTQAHVLEVIDNFRTAAPQARIFMMVPANGRARSPITSAVAARAADTKLHLIDLGTAYQAGIGQGGAATGVANLFASDALHRNLLSNAIVASGFTAKIQAAMGGEATSAPVTGTSTFSTEAMVSSGTLRSNQVCQWTWFAGGSVGSTAGTPVHGSGTLSAAATLTATGLPSGAGYIMARFSDGGRYYQEGTAA